MKRYLVYFWATPCGQFVKIGHCKGNLYSRGTSLYNGCPQGICEYPSGVIVCENGRDVRKVELSHHKQFKAYRTSGEWFKLVDEISEYIQEFTDTESGKKFVKEGKEHRRESIREHGREYRKDPEVRKRRQEYHREYRNDPEYREREQEYRKDPEVRKHKQEYYREYNQRPENRERQQKRCRERYQNDPEYRERKQNNDWESRRKRMNDPEYRESDRERQNKSERKRYQNDPEYRERKNKRNRERRARKKREALLENGQQLTFLE